MAPFGRGLVLLAIAAHPVAADPSSPVEVTAEVHIRSIANFFADDAALDGRGPGASVRLGRSWLHLQASWDYVRETVADPFDPVSYDEHAHQFLIGPAFVWHVGSRVSASAAMGVALTYYNGRGAPELKTGGWTDVRFDIDVVELARGHRIAIVIGGALVLASPGGIAGTIGLGYHLR